MAPALPHLLPERLLAVAQTAQRLIILRWRLAALL
jgi:hypothetical protein